MMAFIFATLTVVAAWTSTKKARAPVLLNRQQTEEWKGWMQARPCPQPSPQGLRTVWTHSSAANGAPASAPAAQQPAVLPPALDGALTEHAAQVLFLLYHYFNAREIYNAIRVFIAGYVWMTGFGNFSYYYKTKDFCLGRCATLTWRQCLALVSVSLTCAECHEKARRMSRGWHRWMVALLRK